MRRLLLMTLAATGLFGQTAYDRFFDTYYFPFNPTSATSAGVHKYDAQLEDYSRAGVAKRVTVLKAFEAEFAKLPASPDRDLVLSTIQSDLLDLETIRMWERDPDQYPSGIANSAFSIMSRNFAPQEVRLKSLVRRMERMPQVLQQARANLKNPPRIYTEVALEQLDGTISFFEHDIPLAFREVKNQNLLDEFHNATRAVTKALRSYQAWLKSDLLPRSNGDFRLGAETYSKKLLYDEMIDIPLDRLLEIGYADLRANQKKFAETAALIDRSKTPQQILAEVEKEHPTPAKLLDTYRNTLAGLKKFIEDRKIVSIPSPVLPILEETPPFLRALTTASMDTPGPYETAATEAYFNVTLPEKDWPADRVENFMHQHHPGVVLAVAVHEAYPGHYVQFLWMQQVQSRVRKLLGAASNAEGWAHYCEQMMLDEGFSNDPRIRLGQIQDALLRDARYIAGIEMHTGKRTFEQAIELFEKEGYQPHEVAVKEAKRGTSDATYLYYTLGKLEIMKLREDYRKLKGPAFSLEEFHTRFLEQGWPPIKIVRHALLGDDSPVL